MAVGAGLSGKRAMVTGAGAGIGAAIARALAADGAELVLSDIDAAAVQSVADELGARAAVLDVADADAVERVFGQTGPFDILVNNAGRDQHAFFTTTTPAEWRMLLDVNLLSVFACTRAVLPHMQARRGGRIVTVASEAGRLGSKGGAVYAAAKGGTIAFSKSIARENARYGITVNVICPGPVRTPMLEQAIAAGGDKLLAAMVSATLLGRLGTPPEVAAAVAFLCSEAAGFITAEVLGVSGGMGAG